MEFFICNKRKIAVKPTVQHNSAVPKALLGKSLIINIMIITPENCGIPHRHRLLGQATKEPVSN